MTSTLTAMLVEEGRVQWTTTIEEVFPTLAPQMQADWRKVNLEQLTSHRSGAPTAVSGTLWAQSGSFPGKPSDARKLLMQQLTATAPVTPPGTSYAYSNFGYAIAGHKLETVMGMDWEASITTRLVQSL